MKKIITLSILFISYISISKAQVIVDVNDFVNNPSKYNGKTIVLQGVIAKRTINNGTASGTTPTATITNPGTVNSPTPNTTGRNQVPNTSNPSGGTTAPIVRCSAPKNWERLEVQLPNNYDGCFVIFNKMSNTLPVNKDVRMDISVKVDTRFMHRVTKIKVLP
jgi:hypothetical protein